MSEKVYQKKAFIGGEWVESESGERFEVNYPGDGSVIGTAPACTRKDAQKAIGAAIEGQKALAKLSLVKRIELLHKAISSKPYGREAPSTATVGVISTLQPRI
jgi:acyl-CoA reductase-like NAD-dependent aldehyde dehydrogenase